MTSMWSYMPLEWATDWTDYPEDFQFGAAEGDDAKFDQVWDEMVRTGHRAIKFDECPTSFVYEAPAGAMIMRQPLVDFSKLIASELTYEDQLKVAVTVATSTECEIIFVDHQCAMVAALQFGGHL